MIALINGDFYEMVPIPAPDGDYHVELAPNATMLAYKGDKRIDYGPKHYSSTKFADIHPDTGKITVLEAGIAHIRTVFNDFHVDSTIGVK